MKSNATRSVRNHTFKSIALKTLPRPSRWLVGLVLLSFVVSCSTPPHHRSPTTSGARAPESVNDSTLLEQFEEDVERRTEWFYFQRAYPFEEIPVEARQRAWESRPPDWISQRGITPAAATGMWQPIGPRPTTSAVPDNWGVTSGRITSIAVSPSDPNLVLIGSASGGIWRSTDAGASFAPVTDNQVDLAVGSIAFSKQNPTIVYAGMGDMKGYLGTGVLKSTDAGQTWTRVNNTSLPAVGTTADVEVDPLDPNRVYLAQYSAKSASSVFSSGVFVSTDGGINWSRKLQGLPRDLAINPASPNTIYAGLRRNDGGGPAGLYRSTDSGNNWSNIFMTPYDANGTTDVKVAVASAQTIYVYTGGFLGGNFEVRVVVSTDGGANWTNKGASNLDTGQFGYNTYIAAHPTNPSVIYVGTRDLFKSTDAGDSYVDITRNLTQSGGTLRFTPDRSNSHIDQHAIAFSAENPNVIYIGNDGGLSKSTDGGATFRSQNGTLSLTQFYSLSIHPTDTSLSYGGTQDNGLQRRSGQQWQEIVTGDFGSIVFKAEDPSVFVANYTRGDIFRFTNNGANREAVGTNEKFGEPDNRPRIGFIAPLVGAGGRLYFGTWRLFTSQNFGNTWQAPAGTLDLTKGVTGFGADVLSAIGVASSNTIYTGSAQGRAMVSTNGGASWTDITAGLPNRFITGITVDPTNPSVVYLCVSGFGSGHVFKTTNGGASWTDISGSLPDIPTNGLAIDPSDPNTIYAGTDIGVFRSTADGSSWSTFSDGMPPVVVRGFATHPSGIIQAATFGRGAYEIGRGPVQPPSISAVVQEGKKTLRIEGTNLGPSPRVFINSAERTDFIASSSSTQVVLKGKPKKLRLVDGDNTIKVVTSTGESSFVFRR